VSADPAAAAGEARRAEVLAGFGAGKAELAELLPYGTKAFDFGRLPSPRQLPLDDEPHLADWERYAAVGEGRIFESLRDALVQLHFPIRAGISETDAYRAATRAGLDPLLSGAATGLELEHSEDLRLILNPTAGGRLPVIAPCGRADFVALLQALAYHNEPAPIPDSQGAATIKGYNNWERIAAYRSRWEAEHPGGDWRREFEALKPRRELYQDRFMVVSDGPYSSVPAAAMGVSEAEWRTTSLSIRMHHESTHYATYRLLGSMQNRAFDEVIADYFGIVAAAGRFRADWLLTFLGLEAFPEYRDGGRLQNYRGEPPLSDSAFAVLQRLVHAAARNLQELDAALAAADRTVEGAARTLLAIAALSLEELASEPAVERLAAALKLP
jgi:hypothetical protein